MVAEGIALGPATNRMSAEGIALSPATNRMAAEGIALSPATNRMAAEGIAPYLAEAGAHGGERRVAGGGPLEHARPHQHAA
eukprot:1024004-Prorocentrum_minimum.AAC.1